jgi:hypothetical protein
MAAERADKAIIYNSSLHPDRSDEVVQRFSVPSPIPYNGEIVRQQVSVWTPHGMRIEIPGQPTVVFSNNRLTISVYNRQARNVTSMVFTPQEGLEGLTTETVEQYHQRRTFQSATLSRPESFHYLTYGQRFAWMFEHFDIQQSQLARQADVSNTLISRVTIGRNEFVPSDNWQQLIPAFETIVEGREDAEVASGILRAGYRKNEARYNYLATQRRRHRRVPSS